MSADRTIRLLSAAIAVALALLVHACAPVELGFERGADQPRIEGDVAVMADGARLPLRVWTARRPRAVVVALHGFNDYANAFAMSGPWFAGRGITVYAYDQRGFGRSVKPGLWAGTDVLVSDLRTVASIVARRHPGVPLYVLGHSMGGAVAMTALAGTGIPEARGAVLVAPAVWGWRAMNPIYKTALWIAAHTVPSFSPTGDGLGIQASDNIEMLRALGRDPLVIKKTRIDAVYGLVSLMDRAYESAPGIRVPVLFLYGDRDQLVPAGPTVDVVRAIPGPVRFVRYRNGWHMLLRDRQRKVVWRDIAAWLRQPRGRLPSGEEVRDIAAVN